MFTGIVEMLGAIVSIEKKDDCCLFSVCPKEMFSKLIVGESIAVNGVCLTVTQYNADYFYVTAVPETLRLTNLSLLQPGNVVNLERAMLAETRIGGHYVQGHVDEVGTIIDIQSDGDAAWLVKISCPEKLTKYIIKKGFIGLDGMSITLVEVGADWFIVTFIPHTIANSVVQNYKVGTMVNIEVDMLAKYVEKLLESRCGS